VHAAVAEQRVHAHAEPRGQSDNGANDPAVLAREHELAGDWPTERLSDEKTMAGHAATVGVEAEDGDGGRLERRTVVEFTGRSAPAFYVRALSD
jgi:hypothetical protein